MTEVSTDQFVPGPVETLELSARIRDVEEMNRRQRDQLADYEQTIRDLRNDMRIIAEALRDEAERRDWCGEYGDWIDAVNERLSEHRMLPCLRSYTATFTVTVDFTLEQRHDAADVATEIAVALDEIPNLTNAMDVSVGVKHLGTEME